MFIQNTYIGKHSLTLIHEGAPKSQNKSELILPTGTTTLTYF